MSRTVSLPRLLVVALLSSVSIGVVLAHWSSQIGAAMEVSTGDVALDVSGDLSFEFPGCTPGSETVSCDKFEGRDIGTAPLSHSASGATFQITGWVYKGGDTSEPVGFYYTVTGGTVEIAVKSGRNVDQATLEEGSGLWLNPACEGDPGPGGAVTCTPKNTSSISNIEFCLKVVSPPGCTPSMQAVVASNVGSIPFELHTSLLGPDPSSTDYCGSFDLTIQRVIGGNPEVLPLYQGPLCDLLSSDVLLDEQVDPGESVEYKLTMSSTEPTSELNGTSGGFIARFEAVQWNEPAGWQDQVESPLTISVGSASVPAVTTETLPDTTPARIMIETVRAPLGSAVPTVVDVFGRSKVTITAWAVDPSDPGSVLGFDFTVRGDPVYVEVQRGSLRWVDERWEEENPHVWHDPYGVVSPEATPITSIEFALVPLADDPAYEEFPVEEPPAEAPLIEEAPAEQQPTEELPAEDPPSAPPAETATLAGFVWLDEDGDGVHATTESGAGGIVVRLLVDGSVLATTTTDAGGSYSFTDLAVGDYTIEIEAPAGHTFTSVGQGGDPALDSDTTPVEPATDPPTGRVSVSLGPGAVSGVADAGLLAAPTGSGG